MHKISSSFRRVLMNLVEFSSSLLFLVEFSPRLLFLVDYFKIALPSIRNETDCHQMSFLLNHFQNCKIIVLSKYLKWSVLTLEKQKVLDIPSIFGMNLYRLEKIGSKYFTFLTGLSLEASSQRKTASCATNLSRLFSVAKIIQIYQEEKNHVRQWEHEHTKQLKRLLFWEFCLCSSV